jgi:tetratricopeptide (TPR) repeat protein
VSQAAIDRAMEAYRHAHILMEGKVGRDIAEAIPHLETAAASWKEALRSQSRAEVLMELGHLHQRLGDYDRAATAFEEALVVFRDTNAKKPAADAGIQAGLARKAQGRPDLAIAYLERSLEILKGDGSMIDIAMAEMTLGSIMLDDRRPADALARYETALPILERFSKRAEIAHAREMMAVARAQAGDHVGSAKDFEATIALKKDQLGDMRGAAKTLSRFADTLRRQDRHDEALARYKQALSIHELRNDLTLQAQTLGNMGTVLNAAGKRDEAISHYRRCLELSKKTGEKAAVAQAHYNLAGILLEGNDHPAALTELDHALVICEELGSRDLASRILSVVADLHSEAGDNERAQAARLRRANLLGQSGDLASQRQALQELLDEALEISDWETAVTYQTRIIAECGATLSDSDMADHRLRQGLLLARLGDHNEAASALTQALLRAEMMSDDERVGRCLRHLGQTELQLGASADAHGHFMRAIERYRKTGDDINLATSLVGLGNALVQLKRTPEAKTILEEAAGLREKLGDTKGTQTIRKATAGL